MASCLSEFSLGRIARAKISIWRLNFLDRLWSVRLTQELIRQNIVYYMLYVFLWPDHNHRLISFLYCQTNMALSTIGIALSTIRIAL